MAYSRYSLVPIVQARWGSAGLHTKYSYPTSDALATVIASGYFNEARSILKVGDLIEAAVDLDGDDAGRDSTLLRVTAVPAAGGGNVTVAVDVAAQGVSGGQTHIDDIALAAVTGVDGTGDNAASKADVDARLTAIETSINGILAALETSGHNLTS